MVAVTEHRPDVPRAAPAGADELRCPLCDYDLRGLAEPRCPECGYRFTWDQIRDPARRLHPYLFEHHPQRSAWSFVRTLVGGLRPRRFWRQLTPFTPSDPRRLVRYWLITLALALPAYALACVGTAREMHENNRNWRAAIRKGAAANVANWERSAGMTVAEYLTRYAPLFPSRRFFAAVVVEMVPRFILTALIAAALWPWVTVMAMRLLLWISLRRAKVHPIHVARCAVHSADVMAWYWLALTGAVACLMARSLLVEFSFFLTASGLWLAHETVTAAAVALLAALLVALYRLSVAFSRYLRLPHAAAVVLLTQFLVLLGVFVLTGITTTMIERVARRIAYQ